MRICEGNNSAHTKVSDPAAPGEDHGEAGCPTAAHGGPQWSRSPPAARGGPHAGASVSPKEAVTLWNTHAGAGSWQDLWPCGERSPCQSRFAGRACDPAGDPHWSSLFLKYRSPWKGPTLGQGQSPRPEEEGAAEKTCGELTTAPIPNPPEPLQGRR